jgi:hypothetical protein
VTATRLLMARTRHQVRKGVVLATALVLAVPATALAATNWGFGTGGQATATVTWQPDDGQDVSGVSFTLPVKVKSAKTRLGTRCTVRRHHPKQVRCPISPPAAFGYVDVKAKKRIPCKGVLHFSAKRPGHSRWVRQSDIQSGNGCG